MPVSIILLELSGLGIASEIVGGKFQMTEECNRSDIWSNFSSTQKQLAVVMIIKMFKLKFN